MLEADHFPKGEGRGRRVRKQKARPWNNPISEQRTMGRGRPFSWGGGGGRLRASQNDLDSWQNESCFIRNMFLSRRVIDQFKAMVKHSSHCNHKCGLEHFHDEALLWAFQVILTFFAIKDWIWCMVCLVSLLYSITHCSRPTTFQPCLVCIVLHVNSTITKWTFVRKGTGGVKEITYTLFT